MSFFKSPKLPDVNIPAPPVAPPAPRPAAPPPTEPKDIAKVKEEEKKKLTRGRKKRATILTGPRGVLVPPAVEKKTLLGG